jgi:hypothetical protein
MVAAIIVTSLGSAHPPDAGQLVSHIPLPTDAKIIAAARGAWWPPTSSGGLRSADTSARTTHHPRRSEPHDPTKGVNRAPNRPGASGGRVSRQAAPFVACRSPRTSSEAHSNSAALRRSMCHRHAGRRSARHPPLLTAAETSSPSGPARRRRPGCASSDSQLACRACRRIGARSEFAGLSRSPAQIIHSRARPSFSWPGYARSNGQLVLDLLRHIVQCRGPHARARVLTWLRWSWRAFVAS